MPTPPKAEAAPAAEVVTVLGQSSVSQRIALPGAKPLAASPTALNPAGLKASSVGHWMGPIPMQHSMYRTERAAVGPQGELTVSAADDKGGSFQLHRYAANGQALAHHQYTVSPNGAPAGTGPYAQTWVTSTEDAPDQELYVMNVYGNARSLYPDPARGPVQAEFRLMNSALQPRTTNVDGPYHLPLLVSSSTEVRAGQQGIVVATPRPWNPSAPQKAPQGTRIYELSHHAWDNVELNEMNVLLPPAQYANNYTSSQMDTAPDGSIYVATFTSTKQQCARTCPSVAGVTKLRGGQVEWQVFWDSAEPVAVEDVSAHENGVGLLITSARSGAGSSADEVHAESSVLLTFSADGKPLQQLTLPESSDSAGFPVAYRQLQLKADGRFVVGAAQTLTAGHVTQGIRRTQMLADAFSGLEVQHLLSRGEYLYVQGAADLGDLAKEQPSVPLPTLPEPAGYESERFVLPYDFDLNPRW
ncbi:hypothetical protein [Deinococcus piscis]|nr:hypothetical protein [Deinococcus piscis]